MAGDIRGVDFLKDSATGKEKYLRFVKPRLPWIVVLGVTFLAHASYINNGFTWLDHIDIEHGKAIVSPSQWYTAFTTRYGETGFYRPLVTLAHSFDAALYGRWPPGFHLTNVLLHLGVVASAILFLGCFIPLERREVMLAGLIVGSHPLSWLPVGAISYRPELLVTLFTLMAVYFHAKARISGTWPLISLAGLSVLLGLFSKETALVWIPSFILLWEIAGVPRASLDAAPNLSHRHSSERQKSEGSTKFPLCLRGKGALVLFLGEFFAVGVYLFLRVHSVPELWRVSAVTLPLSQGIGTRLQVVGGRLLEVVSPLKPALSDATPIVPITALPAILTALVVLLGLGVVVRSGLQSGWSIAVFFLAIALAPGANIVPLARFNSPHYGYLSVVGGAMLVLLTLQSLDRNIPATSRYFKLAIVVWLVVMSAVTFAKGFQFRDDLTLFGPEVKRDPYFLEGHYYLGNYFMEKGENDRAAIRFGAALQNLPHVIAYVDRPAVLINLAGVRLRQARLEEAEQLLQLAAEAAPAYRMSMIAYDRALVAARQEDYAAVVDLLNDETYHWDRPEPLLVLAKALRKLDREEEALNVLTRALPLLDEESRRKLEVLFQTQR